MFTKILIANRGEIACRVAATCRSLGIQTVAVYSDADAHAKHVTACDEAVHIGGAAPKDSYLRGAQIIAVALQTGAQAVHPGYGFLSENEDFAEACAQAGLVFIGPPPSAIRAMGLKAESKRLMEAAKVPLVPGYHGAHQDPTLLHQEADRIGYPVLLKASAGGGGKGMRVVERSADFPEALQSCKREAISSFGDDAVLIEKYLTRPRHIEIQVFADRHGNCVYLFERDCSVQRRHQKVLEEAPAPNMPETRRQAMGEAAVAAAKAVGYEGAGTVEFIANQDGSFYFMEMNTRLQVEHPVTEMITGQDLVAWQLRVAAGEPLPVKQADLRIHGHALEARVYAENPDNQFLPSTGTLKAMRTPAAVHFALGRGINHSDPAGVRIDSGVGEGDVISPFYDPMIAKLIVWGKDRAQALAKMRQALAEFHVVGLSTNLTFLQRLVSCQAFANADLDTGLIASNLAHLFPATQAPSFSTLALATAAQLENERQSLRNPAQDAHSPWGQASGWRMHATQRRTLDFSQMEGEHSTHYPVSLEYRAAGLCLAQGAQTSAFHYEVVHADARVTDIRVRLAQQQFAGRVVRDGRLLHVFSQGQHSTLHWHDPLTIANAEDSHGGKLTAPMPGKIVAVHVKVGDKVQQGMPLLVMEAMKMEHSISAPHDGVVEAILYALGEQVNEGAQLLALQTAEAA